MPTRLVTLVANTVQRVLGENRLRKDFTLKNDTAATDIFHGNTREVATTGVKQGGIIDPAGGSYNDRWYKGEVWVISTGAVDLTVQENISDGPEISNT